VAGQAARYYFMRWYRWSSPVTGLDNHKRLLIRRLRSSFISRQRILNRTFDCVAGLAARYYFMRWYRLPAATTVNFLDLHLLLFKIITKIWPFRHLCSAVGLPDILLVTLSRQIPKSKSKSTVLPNSPRFLKIISILHYNICCVACSSPGMS
jgi:hypothetical protein